jgi:hypothetical protein
LRDEDTIDKDPRSSAEIAADEVHATRSRVRKVKQAADQYYRSTGEAPGSPDALIERKYIKKDDKKDAWRSELRLLVNDSSDGPVQVCSDGPDKEPGSDDDICEPQTK